MWKLLDTSQLYLVSIALHCELWIVNYILHIWIWNWIILFFQTLALLLLTLYCRCYRHKNVQTKSEGRLPEPSCRGDPARGHLRGDGVWVLSPWRHEGHPTVRKTLQTSLWWVLIQIMTHLNLNSRKECWVLPLLLLPLQQPGYSAR